MRRIRRSIRSSAGVGILAVVAAACGGGDDAAEGLASGDDYSVAAALDDLPSSIGENERWMISTGDLSLASELSGLDKPTDVDHLSDWLVEVTNGGARGGLEADPAVFVPVGRFVGAGDPPGAGAEEFGDELGWSIVDTDAFVEIDSPPEVFTVVVGDDLDDSLSDDLVEVADGVVSNTDRDDGQQDLSESSGVDRLGRPVRLAQVDSRIALGLSTPAISAWRDGGADTIADDDEVRVVAEQLDDQGAYAAVIVHRDDGFTFGRQRAVPREVYEEHIDDMPPEPFDTVGVGWAVEDGEPLIVLVFSQADGEAADANERAFADLLATGSSLQGQRPLSDLIDAESVRATGETLVEIRLRPGPEWRPGTVFRMLTIGDAPFIHA